MTSTAVLESMFNHLTQSYSADDAREILIGKYPEQEGVILTFKLSSTSDEVPLEADAPEAPVVLEKVSTAKPPKAAKPKAEKAPKAAKPKVAAKVAKPKAEKAPKAKKASKMDQARELYAKASDKSRKAMIELFGKKLGLSPAAASTYFYTVKN